MAESVAEDTTDEGEKRRLAKNDAEDFALCEAQGLENSDFTDALADRHGHGVGRNENDGEGYGCANAEEEYLDVSQHGDKSELKCFFRFGPGLLGRVAEHFVYSFGDRAGVLGVVDQDREGTGEIAARSGHAFK